ncbi:MAG: cytochrome P450 [Actinomycetota bacterium]|uniref:Cytochrome P450 n=1 Tax=Mycobacterium lentiflavum TaxID=141349 RepID=A0ABY3UUT1_MYCLN|nr:cytochrome P450 [Mycobacterium lentiflavum]MEE3067616.1 cytochrome P450 [Actinomycetota bacterium]ULP43341.1 cytochrome P450 [Mycobacterium lentiflavum]
MTETTIDLAEPGIWASRFPDELFAALRARTPVFHQQLTAEVKSVVGREFWVCTKHADVARVHRDHESFTATGGPLIQDVPLFDAYPAIVSLDPPDHTIRRKVISRAFTPRAVAKLEDGIRQRAKRMAGALLESGGGDFVDLAAGLPISVIGDIVGIPEADRPHVFGLIEQVLKTAGAQLAMPDGDDVLPFAELFQYASTLTANKREHPVDDIWSALCTTEITADSGESFLLPSNELEIFFFVLGLAGADTTRNALCDGIRAFVANPHQIDVYRSEPDARATAVEEVLRYSTPIMFWVRGATRDVILGDTLVPEGARVVTMLRSANRDEDVFEDPHRFDVRRDPNPHQSFGGGGPHHCLGAMLARAEIRAALDEILLNADVIETGEPTMTLPDLCNNMTVYDSLPVTLG